MSDRVRTRRQFSAATPKDAASLRTPEISGRPGVSPAVSILLLGLIGADIAIRLAGVAGNTNFLQGDVLAPFSLFDQFRAGEAADLSRQPWILPWFAAQIWRLAGSRSDFHSLLTFYSAFSAVAVSLTLPLVFLLARRAVSDVEALLATLLVACNASLYLASIYISPTLVLGLCLTGVTLCLAELPRRPIAMACLTVLAGAAGFLARWEGALLLVLANTALLGAARRGVVPLRVVLVLAGASLLLMFGIGVAHIRGSSTPFAFLHNTNAIAPAWSFFGDSPGEQLRITIRAISWKMEKLNAFSVDLTFIGVVLAAIGAVNVLPRLPALAFPIIYWVCYELVMLVFTLIVPIGSDHYLTFFDVLSTGPVDRYYQIFTPVATILLYCGLRSIVVAVEHTLGFKAARWLVSGAAGVFLAALFAVYPVYTAQRTYFDQYWPFARTGIAADLVDTADFFRGSGVRGRDIYVARDTAHGLEFVDTFPSSAPGYALSVFHFSILSGHNRVNCTGYNLDDPNLFCSALSHSQVVDLTSRPGSDVNFLILEKPLSARRQIPASFHLVHADASFAVFARR
ncbi:MAG TPA: hypothetical protein VGR45_10675 [Stellaceae bacterium]|nr:hypothetical protein [Stellaceae bacterium]